MLRNSILKPKTLQFPPKTCEGSQNSETMTAERKPSSVNVGNKPSLQAATGYGQTESSISLPDVLNAAGLASSQGFLRSRGEDSEAQSDSSQEESLVDQPAVVKELRVQSDFLSEQSQLLDLQLQLLKRISSRQDVITQLLQQVSNALQLAPLPPPGQVFPPRAASEENNGTAQPLVVEAPLSTIIYPSKAGRKRKRTAALRDGASNVSSSSHGKLKGGASKKPRKDGPTT